MEEGAASVYFNRLSIQDLHQLLSRMGFKLVGVNFTKEELIKCFLHYDNHNINKTNLKPVYAPPIVRQPLVYPRSFRSIGLRGKEERT